MQQALGNIRVLDLTRVLAGPWCTQNMADMGADVIKVEHLKGDDTRKWGPPWVIDSQGNQSQDATYYASANRGKKSVQINIATQEGADLVRELALKSDVLIENFKVGDLARYGLDYESIRKINPRIIYCSITGYGQTGPYADRPGYDFVFQAEGGLMSITGERDSLPGGGPQKMGVAIADLTAGLYAAVAVLAALNLRHQTGKGQHIDLALLDCVTSLASNQGLYQLINNIDPVRWGNAHPALVPYQVFDTLDGQIVVAVGNEQQWLRFCKAIERQDLFDNPKYRDAKGRIEDRDSLLPGIEADLACKTTDHWLEAFSSAKVPHGRLNNYREVFAHPQVVHRNMAISVPKEDGEGSVKSIANPIKFSETPIQYRHAPPELGAHTERVLTEVLELSGERLHELEQAGVIRSPKAAAVSQ